MDRLELLGYAASLASGGAFLPQAVRAIRSRQTKDLSLPSLVLGEASRVFRRLLGLSHATISRFSRAA